MPGKLKSEHHTLADWDFEFGSEGRFLSDDYFISPPTCLKMEPPSEYIFTPILCRIPGTLCLPQGELRTWLRSIHGDFILAGFRNQAPLGTATRDNCYYIMATPTDTRLYLRLNDAGYLHSSTTPCYVIDEWQHFRIFWYNGFNPAEEESLCVDIYLDVASEWVKQGSTLYSRQNRWKDSEINRCGPFPHTFPAWPKYWDDTEIWGPV
ncbi:hypothetical protein ES705_35826 [subsurface metagenome]